MSSLQVLLVAGTHGNEINAPWLFHQYLSKPDLLNEFDLKTVKVLGNPIAYKMGKRYVDRDLNRSFRPDLLIASHSNNYEAKRAKELLNLFGSEGKNPCQIALDFHSTTSAMGTSLVVYGRRPSDLALASLIQFRLGLPIYLHEQDSAEQGFLVESWPCGLVVEIGPVPQNFLDASIVQKTSFVLESCLEEISKVRASTEKYPERIVVHRHLGSLDLPRGGDGIPKACLHKDLQGSDWFPIQKGSPLFVYPNGSVERYFGEDNVVPVFINEAAYAEKGISMSFAIKEFWSLESSWKSSLKNLLNC